MRFIFFYHSLPHYTGGQKLTFQTTLTEEPEITQGWQKFAVRLSDGTKITVYNSLSQMLHFTDRIEISGKLTQREFSGHTYFVMYFPALKLRGKDRNFLAGSAGVIKNKANTLFNSTLSPIQASLVSGMLFGGNKGMPDQFLQSLQNTGVLHVTAASGMNVTFVAGAFLSVLGSVMRRQFALFIGIGGIVFYAFLAGGEPAIVRASIMAGFAFGANLLGRQNYAVFSLLFAAYLMLLYNPGFLTDTGFQLSFLATLGILFVKPLFPEKKNALLFEDVKTTLAAQAAVTPVLASIFGKIGLLSLLANALVLWTIPFIMTISSSALMISFLFEPLGKLTLLLCLPLLMYFEWIVTMLGNAGWVVEVKSIPVMALCGYYLFIAGFVVFIQRRKVRVLEIEQT